jgi:hypothetical protein
MICDVKLEMWSLQYGNIYASLIPELYTILGIWIFRVFNEA